MAKVILPDSFLRTVFEKFQRDDWKDDPISAIAMQQFLVHAEKNPASLEEAKSYIENDAAISTFIEKVRFDHRKLESEKLKAFWKSAYKKAKTDLNREFESSFNEKVLNRLKKIDESTVLAVEMIEDAQKENAELRQDIRDANNDARQYRERMQKKLDEAHAETKAANDKLEKARTRTIRFFKITFPISVTSLLIGLSGLAARFGWFDPPPPKQPNKDQKQGQASQQTPQESGSACGCVATPAPPEAKVPDIRRNDAPPPSGKAIPLEHDSLRGPCDPFTGRRMIDLGREPFSLPDAPDTIFYFDVEPALPGPRRKSAQARRPSLP